MAVKMLEIDENIRMTVILPNSLRDRVKACARTRMSSELQTIRWLLTTRLDEWESLSKAERVSA